MFDYYLNTAVDFVKKLKPTKIYEIGGLTIGQESIISEGGYGYVYLAHDRNNFDK